MGSEKERGGGVWGVGSEGRSGLKPHSSILKPLFSSRLKRRRVSERWMRTRLRRGQRPISKSAVIHQLGAVAAVVEQTRRLVLRLQRKRVSVGEPA